jgi:hypothetical protein
MDFGINVDYAVRRGGTHEGSFQEAFELVDLAEDMGLDTAWLGEGHFLVEATCRHRVGMTKSGMDRFFPHLCQQGQTEGWPLL